MIEIINCIKNYFRQELNDFKKSIILFDTITVLFFKYNHIIFDTQCRLPQHFLLQKYYPIFNGYFNFNFVKLVLYLTDVLILIL